jgi:hypothetical protein
MATHFKGPIDSHDGFKVGGKEVINSSGNLTTGTITEAKVTTSAGSIYPVVAPNATVAAKAATANLAAGDFGKNITNTGAGDAIVLTLPAAATVKGKVMRVQLTVAKDVSLSPATTEKVFLGGDGVANKDLVIAGVIGNYADIYCDGTDYFVVSYSGVLTKEG